MKFIPTLLAFGLLASPLLKASDFQDLDGNRYCLPSGEKKLCVAFANGYLIDGTTATSGKPIERELYRVLGNDIQSEHNGDWITRYKLKGQSISSKNGTFVAQD